MASQPALISGRVVETSGKPVANARVLFVSAPQPLPDIAAVTDQTGRFSLAAPAPGAYTIELAADGFQSKRITVAIVGSEAKDLRVELQPAQ
jgi:protocatechuate 3,4-dioxygenase beta subunit